MGSMAFSAKGWTKKGIWRGFGLTTNGWGGFTLTVVNKLAENTAVSDKDTAVYLPNYVNGNDEDAEGEEGED